VLCEKNAHCILLGSNFEKGQAALGAVREAVGKKARADFFQCNLTSRRLGGPSYISWGVAVIIVTGLKSHVRFACGAHVARL
jgi:hypothetical protein